MSFFKNITKEFEGLMSDDKKSKKAEKHDDDQNQRGKTYVFCFPLHTFVDTVQSDFFFIYDKTRDIFLNLSVLCSRFRTTGQPSAV